MTDHQQEITDHDTLPPIEKIDLNAATEEELCRLPGIGPALAARIVNYRTQVSPFKEPSDIASVPGITEAMYQLMAEQLTVASEPGPEDKLGLWPTTADDFAIAESQTIDEDFELDRFPASDSAGITPVQVAAEEPMSRQPELPQTGDDASVAAPPEDFDQQVPTTEDEPPAAQREPAEEPPIIAYTSPPQGGHWGRLFVFGLAGAVLGAMLALAFLLMVNGTLNFQMASSKALNSEALRLDDEIDEMAMDLSQLRGRVDVLQDLSMRLENAQADFSHLAQDVGTMQSEVESLRRDATLVQDSLATVRQHTSDLDQNLSALQAQATAMAERLDALQSHLDTLGKESQRFRAFLTGLQQLLNQPIETQPDATPISPLLSTPTPRPTSVLRPQITVIPLATPTP
jgi:competence ComEA-like helix-hairpin-helix protein